MHECPVEFAVIMKTSRSPKKDFLRSFAMSSQDPYFKSEEFWRELLEYNPGKTWKPTAKEELRMIRSGKIPVNSIDRILDSL